MTRRLLLTVPLISLACTRPTRNLAEILPAQVQTFFRHNVRPISSSNVPALIAGLGLEKAALARYEGEGRISVQIYEMKGETSAFELIQKWPPPDGLAIYKGPYFVVAKSNNVDQKQIAAFLQEFRSKLP